MGKLYSLIAGIIVFVAILLLPVDSELFTQSARLTAAITGLIIVFWIAQPIPMEATALIPLFAFPIFQILSPTTAAVSYADPIIFLFLGGFILAAAMQKWGLHKYIALKIINVTGTNSKQLILGFMIATAFLSMWLSNTATAMMMIPIAVAIILTVLPSNEFSNMNRSERDFAACLVLGIAYAASIGGMATLIGTPANGIFAAQLLTMFPESTGVDFSTWFIFALPLVIILIPLVWFWMTHVVYRKMPVKLSEASNVIHHEIENLGPLSRGSINTLIVLAIVVFCWIFRTTKDLGFCVIPGLDTFLPFIDDSTIAIFGAVLLFVLPVNSKWSEFTLDWESAVKIPWGILLLFGGGLCISAAFIKSGLSLVIADCFQAFSIVPLFILVLLVGLIVSILTEFTSNTAIANIMIPIVAIISVYSFELNPVILMAVVAIASSLAFMMPVATPANAIAFSTEYVDIRSMIRTGFVLNFISVIILTIFIFVVVIGIGGISTDLPDWAYSMIEK